MSSKDSGIVRLFSSIKKNVQSFIFVGMKFRVFSPNKYFHGHKLTNKWILT